MVRSLWSTLDVSRSRTDITPRPFTVSVSHQMRQENTMSPRKNLMTHESPGQSVAGPGNGVTEPKMPEPVESRPVKSRPPRYGLVVS